jgi:hypothetical protein
MIFYHNTVLNDTKYIEMLNIKCYKYIKSAKIKLYS